MKYQFIDQAVAIGPRASLVGVVTRPIATDGNERPAFVILNTGIIHRVGHHRMYVTLSRMLAAAGHTVLRFDLSGLGDSDTRSDGLSPLDAALADIRDAVDWLTEGRADDRVILMGLCSGADHAMIYSQSDPRVVGLALIDPSVPRTVRYYILFVLRNLLHAIRTPALWRRLKRRLAGIPDAPRLRAPQISNRKVRAYLEAAYRASVERGVQFLAIFTSSAWVGQGIRPYGHNYHDQLLEALPNVEFGSKLRLEYFRTADHLFGSESDRKKLFEVTLGWAQQTVFAPAASNARTCARATMAHLATVCAAGLT